MRQQDLRQGDIALIGGEMQRGHATQSLAVDARPGVRLPSHRWIEEAMLAANRCTARLLDDKKLPGIAAEDIGRCAYGIFKAGDATIGKTVGISGEHLSGAEMAATLSKVLGHEIVHNAVTPDAYRSFGFPGADDLGNMFQFKRDLNADFRQPRDVEFSRLLNPELSSFEQWVSAHKAQILVP